MSQTEPIAEKLPANANYPNPTSWTEGLAQLTKGQWYWLTTVRPNSHPHVRPILSVWSDGALYFVSNENARKTKNLKQNAHCSISVATDEAHLVVEGRAVRITDAAELQRVANVYASKYDWHVTVRDGVFDADYGAPTAGPPPFQVYRLMPTTIFGFGTNETFSPTRWRFDDE